MAGGRVSSWVYRGGALFRLESAQTDGNFFRLRNKFPQSRPVYIIPSGGGVGSIRPTDDRVRVTLSPSNSCLPRPFACKAKTLAVLFLTLSQRASCCDIQRAFHVEKAARSEPSA